MPRKKQDRVRVTVPMEPEVLAEFTRMAGILGVSVGRAIADWCSDTAEGIQFVRGKMEQAKRAPMLVMREMEAMAKGLQEEVAAKSRELAAARRGRPEGGRGGR